MIIGFGNRLLNTYEDVCNAVNDVTMSINGDPETSSQYRLIPTTKSGKKHLLINAVECSTLDETIIYLGTNTVGVKLYSKGHTPICSYSVSKNGTVQLIKIEFPDGTGIEQRSVYDSNSNAYLFDTTTFTVDCEEIEDTIGSEIEFMNKKTKAEIIYYNDPNNKTFRVKTRFAIRGSEVNPQEFESKIQELIGSIKENEQPFIQAFTDCLSLNSLGKFYGNMSNFKVAFRNMLKQLEVNPENQNPQFPSSEEPNDSTKDISER